ncbi:hypothetical protein L3556_10355 [Candidatus Synechococcus calcipolaris G9]|uniref:Histidine kinase n=1 Tax=Candidatus Synechococcus calcipolaris G9 TaxID=1497997 RepID=A0ABT6F0H8_9SYNE|nr:hypothetical protein [Candidatus Synechococcus calcipolaris]MDG2991327.1 hypothetical protein [Candidatus Synechococcus calcipolaris G9]
MVRIVIIANILIALAALWTALQLIQVRRILRGVAHTLDDVERSTHDILGGAPEAIIIGQKGVAGLRQTLPELGKQQRKVIRFLGLISWMGQRWPQRPWRKGRKKRYE